MSTSGKTINVPNDACRVAYCIFDIGAIVLSKTAFQEGTDTNYVQFAVRSNDTLIFNSTNWPSASPKILWNGSFSIGDSVFNATCALPRASYGIKGTSVIVATGSAICFILISWFLELGFRKYLLTRLAMRQSYSKTLDTQKYLEAMRANSRAIISAIPDAILTFDCDGKLIYLNRHATAITQYEQNDNVQVDEIIAEMTTTRRTSLDQTPRLHPTLQIPHLLLPTSPSFDMGPTNTIQQGVHSVLMKRKSGIQFPAEINISIVGIREGAKPTAISRVLILRDLTTERDLANGLRTAQKEAADLGEARNALISFMAHELRNSTSSNVTYDVQEILCLP